MYQNLLDFFILIFGDIEITQTLSLMQLFSFVVLFGIVWFFLYPLFIMMKGGKSKHD